MYLTHPVEQDLPEHARVPLGRPLDHCDVYVLDARLEPVPIGMTGEICVGGFGVTRGYLGDPATTAALYVPDPYSGRPGARLYRTGDLGRYTREGVVELLGRRDARLKIRGFRIEPGEIVAVLRQCPGVDQAVVIAGGDADTPRLIAYIACADEARPSIATCVRRWRSGCPRTWCPPSGSSCPRCRSPRTASWITPRCRHRLSPRARSPTTRGRHGRGSGLVSASGPMCWAVGGRRPRQLLRARGDSILAIQAIGRAREVDLRLTARQMFERQTVAALAAVLEPIERVPLTTPTPADAFAELRLAPIQQWFFDGDPPNPHHRNQEVLLALSPEADLSLLEQALEHLVTHHEMLRARFEHGPSGWRAWIGDGRGVMAYRHVDLSAVDPGGRHDILRTDAADLHATLHLTAGPLLRAASDHSGQTRAGVCCWSPIT